KQQTYYTEPPELPFKVAARVRPCEFGSIRQALGVHLGRIVSNITKSTNGNYCRAPIIFHWGGWLSAFSVLSIVSISVRNLGSVSTSSLAISGHCAPWPPNIITRGVASCGILNPAEVSKNSLLLRIAKALYGMCSLCMARV